VGSSVKRTTVLYPILSGSYRTCRRVYSHFLDVRALSEVTHRAARTLRLAAEATKKRSGEEARPGVSRAARPITTFSLYPPAGP